MIKADFINAVQEKMTVEGKYPSKSSIDEFITGITETIVDVMAKGDTIKVGQLGTFSRTVRKAKDFVNPKTKEIIPKPDTNIPKFKFSQNVKDVIAGE